MISAAVPSTRKPSRLSHILTVRRPFASRDADAVSVKSAALSEPHVDNYRLTRVGTNATASSMFSTASVYRVTLELSPKEISLLRYTWNRMLVEEPVEEEKKLLLPIPGSAWALLRDKPLPSVRLLPALLSASLTFCSQLYLNLLAMDPQLETAFPLLRHQAVSMAGVMLLAINLLENLPTLDEYLMELANRHLRILGIEPAQFELMGEALVQTFVERFGTRFTKELEILWIKFYLYLANSLLQFGMDPVLRLDGTRFNATNDVYLESVFTADSDAALLMNLRRMSQSTGATSVVLSVRPAALDVEKKLNLKPTEKKRKRTRLGRKKGDCVIT